MRYKVHICKPDLLYGKDRHLSVPIGGSFVGRDGSVGIGNCYGLDSQGIESWWGEIFRTRPDRLWGPPSLLYNGYRVFPWGKAAGSLRWPPTPSSADVKGRVELYLYSPSGPSWPVLGLDFICGSFVFSRILRWKYFIKFSLLGTVFF
jgi:hypothetical protein